MILWSSLFKDYPIEGKKQLLAINDGEHHSCFIDRLAEQDHVNFPIVLKLDQMSDDLLQHEKRRV